MAKDKREKMIEVQEPNGMAAVSQRARLARDPMLAQARPADESQTDFEVEQFGETEKGDE